MESLTVAKPMSAKRISAFLALLLLLAACGGGGDTTTADDAPTTSSDSVTDSDTETQAEGEPIKIGVMNPFSGAFAIYGEEVYRGYELAVEDAGGEVLGRPIELHKGDALTPDDAIAEAERLATQVNVDAFIGTYVSGVANAASDVANQHNKVYWDTNAQATDLTERGLENFIRVGPNANDFADRSVEVILELIAERLDKEVSELVVYLEHEDSIYGTSVAERQQEQLEAAGVSVAANQAHSAGAADLTDSILRAQEANPDVWVQTGYVTDTNLLLRTARDQGFSPPAILLQGTGDTFETLEALGADYLDGVLVTVYPYPDVAEDFGPGSSAFLEAYQEKYGEDPIAPQSMTAYTGAKILFEVLEAAGSVEVDAVRAAAADLDKPLNSYPTGVGVQFDENFQNTRAHAAVIQWQDGEQVTVFPEDAVSGSSSEIVNLPRE